MFTDYSGQSELITNDVINHGQFKGAGHVYPSGGSTFSNFGTIAPDTLHPLDVDLDLHFAAGSIFEVSIEDTVDWSILNIDGELSFSSGSLDIILSGSLPVLGDTFTVLTWTGTRSGQFGSVDDEFGFSGNLFFQPVYNLNSLDLAVVPEPSTWALMGLGCALVFYRFRRKI